MSTLGSSFNCYTVHGNSLSVGFPVTLIPNSLKNFLGIVDIVVYHLVHSSTSVLV